MSVELSGRCQHLTLFLAINSTTSMHNYTISTMESRWLRTVFDILDHANSHSRSIVQTHLAPRRPETGFGAVLGLWVCRASANHRAPNWVWKLWWGFGGSGAKIVLPADIAALRNSNFCPCDLPCDLDEVGTVAAVTHLINPSFLSSDTMPR